MNILTIETSGAACEVAVLRTGTGREATAVLMRRAVTSRLRQGEGRPRHAEALFGLMDQALRRAGCARGELDAVAVSIGPGSFTGLRIGLAAAKVLAKFGRLKLIGVSTLEAAAARAAAAAAEPAARYVPVVDAMRGEVYAAAYRLLGGNLRRVVGPLVCGPAALARLLTPGSRLVTEPPTAASVAALAVLRLRSGFRGDDPDRLVPAYVRRPSFRKSR